MADTKVILISQVFYPDEVAVSNLLTKLFGKLVSNHGISAKVWCAQPSYTTRVRQPSEAIYQGVGISYLTSTNFPKSKMLGRLLNVFTFSFSVFFRLLFHRGKEIVMVHTTPPFLAIIVIFIARLKGLKVVYVLMDIFPDGLIRLGKASPYNPLVWLWKRWHKNALRHSSQIVTIGRDMAEWVRSEVPSINDKRLSVIPIWQDEMLISPKPWVENPFVSRNGLEGKFVVQFSGNMGLWNDMETIGKAVRAGIPGVMFMFIGDGIRRGELLNSIGNDNPDNAIFLPFLSNEEYAYSVTACHCGLVTLRMEAVGMAVPSKIIGILAAGIPVLAVSPDDSELARIVKENGCGLVVKPGDVEKLVSSILFLRDNEAVRTQMGRNARAAFEEKYTTAKAAESYSMLLKNL